ncbi:alpha/beta hydrolase family protein [Cohnella faecalis]|uniref:Alpha/beta hydrolase n=1 Tax=Cohnella faecalis TaxID=2315694 RepID=A0A398CGM8_9BACL|nr:alpha/beta hydrolase [Cohnella faecalis]RIE01893.1 alpha/beta hydrolase [Cohnella faecalis]
MVDINRTELTETSRGQTRREKLRHKISGMYRYDYGLWRWASAGLWAVVMAVSAFSALGMPTGLGIAFDVGSAMALMTAAMALTAWLAALVLALVGLKLPRLATGCFLFAGALVSVALQYSEWDWRLSLVGAALLALAGAGAGALTGWAAARKIRWRQASIVLLACILLAAAIRYTSAVWPGKVSGDDDSDTVEVMALASAKKVEPLAADPSQPGTYSYRYFTYGSGDDERRSDFGEDVLMLSDSVDGSPYLKGWRWLRTLFWGFDAKELPVNGRVWMPEGEGPFPLVLMVHGNHLMEKFSDEGYGYLGELLASRGFIAVSVDENFLNYSVWSDVPKEDMKARAWMLLKHVGQIQSFSTQADSPFYNLVDFKRVALLGHSRGGQAAAMAADRGVWFPEDEGLPAIGSYEVQAVIALAPTDTTIGNNRSKLSDISYLTLQGAKDTDLVNFYGDRQYGRASFDAAHPERFKASLYIGDANHSRFNTEWGDYDNAIPASLFIRPEGVLAANEQRQIAKVYVSAFLEATLHGETSQRRLFQDYRAGLALLPDTRYFSRYEDGSFQAIARFEGDSVSDLGAGITAKSEGVSDWRHADAVDRQEQAKGNRGVRLEWEKGDASYEIRWDGVPSAFSEDGSLAFSLADLSESDAPLSIDVELTDESGTVARLPLASFMPLARPLPNADMTWFEGMDKYLSDGKFRNASEFVYQTYRLPLEEFSNAAPDFRTDRWKSVTFRFHGGPAAIMLDDVGYAPSREEQLIAATSATGAARG